MKENKNSYNWSNELHGATPYVEDEQLKLIWEKINKRKRRRYFIILFFSVPLIAVVAYLFIPNKENEVQSVVTMNLPCSISKNELNETTNIVSTTIDKNNLHKTKVNQKSKIINSTHIQLNTTRSIQNNNSSIEYFSNVQTIPRSEEYTSTSSLPIKKNEPLEEIRFKNVTEYLNLLPIKHVHSNDDLIQLNNKIIPQSKNLLHKLTYTIGSSFGMNQRTLKGLPENQVLQIRTKFEKELETFGLDLLVNYSIHQNWKFTSGLSLLKSTTKTLTQIKRVSTATDSNYIYRIEELENGQIKNYSGSTSYVLHEDLDAKIYNRYYSIFIPVWVGYQNKFSSRWNYCLQSGISYNVFQLVKGRRINPMDPEFIPFIKNSDYKSFGYIKVDTRIGLIYNWTSALSFGMGLQNSWVPNSILSKSSNYSETTNTSLIYFNINKKF